MKKLFLSLMLVSIILLTCSCSKKEENVLNVLNWTSYIPDDVIHDFEKEYGIKVNYGTYSSNEELLAKISSSKKSTYDLIFPSDYMVEVLKERNLVEKIDKYKLTNYRNINPLFLKQEFDKDNEYSLPFLMATTLIAVNTENIKDDITGYNDLLNKKYKNNIVLLDDQRIVIGAALQSYGYEMNDFSDEHLEDAYNYLMKLKKNVKAFDSDSPKTFLISKEVDIGLIWNAEGILARDENPNIKLIYPKEGYALSMDNYVLVKNSKNKENAYLFIDYLLRDDVSQKIIDEYPYISTNKNIQTYTDEELYQILSNGSYVKNSLVNGENGIRKFDKLWARIK